MAHPIHAIRTALLLGALLAALAPPVSQAKPLAPRPNVLLILADDIGWNDVGYHGSEIRTSRIDELAREGVARDRFYAFPTCTPTRVALHAGGPPLVMGLHGPLEEGNGVPEGEPMLAEAYPEVVRELKAALDAFPQTPSTFVPPKPWEIDQLFGGAETGPRVAESAARN